MLERELAKIDEQSPGAEVLDARSNDQAGQQSIILLISIPGHPEPSLLRSPYESRYIVSPMVPTVEWHKGAVRLLDQSRLPETVAFLDCRDVQAVASAIRGLKVRGAPAIGVTAAMGVALGAQAIRATDYDAFVKALVPICDELAATRPTAVNLFWAIDRMKRKLAALGSESVSSIKAALLRESQAILDEDIALCKAMGRHGADLIQGAKPSSLTAMPAPWRRRGTGQRWVSSARRGNRGKKLRSLPTKRDRSYRERASRHGSSCRTTFPLRSSRTIWRGP